MNNFASVLKSKWILLLLYTTFLSGFASCSFVPTSTATPTLTLSPTSRVNPTLSPTSGVKPTLSPTSKVLTYTPFAPLLAKVLATGAVYVTGDQAVPEAALTAANTYLEDMLQHRPDIIVTLRQNGTFTVVASRTQHICDLSYFKNLSSSDCAAYGEGGAGGTASSPITACDEQNLLAESSDPYQRGGYYSQNICVHELAHTIMDVGLPQADIGRIVARFQAAKQQGLWTGDYAMTNEFEFWAVMSQFYFCAGPNHTYSTAFNHVANCPNTLKQYDPATFALLDSIYKGSTDLH